MPSDRFEQEFVQKTVSAQQAIARIRSGDRVYVGSNCGHPVTLTAELVNHADRLSGVEVVHLATFGPAPYVEPGLRESFRHVAFFIGPNTRAASDAGRVEYMPVFLSDIPRLFKSGQLGLDVALVSVSPPDDHGFCSLGVSVDIGYAACRSARSVIAEVNPNMPRTLGDGFLHVSEIDAFVAVETPIIEFSSSTSDPVTAQIGRNIAVMIDDGATLQTGIGAIPSAVLNALGDKNDLGIHTELFGDELVAAIERGNVNCRQKTLHRDRVVATFVLGTRPTYDAIHNNPFFYLAPTEYVNDPNVIARNDRMVAINGALEVDLTGQVVADSIGSRIYSGIGGQVDFIRGASLSKGGKPILTLPSTARGGEVSRIVAQLAPGAGVVTSRADVRYVVTEYGVAYLHGKTLRQRALALIRIAHPSFRDALLAQAKELGLVPQDQPSVEVNYPAHLAREIHLNDGTALWLRPILPTDDQLLRRHFHTLSPEAVHHRFHRAIRMLSDRVVSDLVNVDYQRHMALVATERVGEVETIVATARAIFNDVDMTAELAFAIIDPYRGRGLGRVLLAALIDHARSQRIVALKGYIEQDNRAMIHLMETCGLPYAVTHEEDMKVFTLEVTPTRSAPQVPAPDRSDLPSRSSL